jgi:hypothetical protein
MRDVICAQCGSSFDRGYPISAARAAKAQFCRRECQTTFVAERARDRLAHRFWSKVKIGEADECWPWEGRRSDRGYGEFDYGNRPVVASRFAYFLSTGIDPGDVFVCHSCDNPPCCNPGHLWPGTHRDNMRDMALKKRAHITGWKGADHPSAKLSLENVLTIRASSHANADLAIQYGVTAAAIYNIRERKTWRHV